MWALRDGLTLARELNLNSLIVEMDAMSVVCKSLDRSITENKEKKSDAVIDESAQVERQRGREAEH